MVRKSVLAGLVAIVVAASVAAMGWAIGGVGTPARTAEKIPENRKGLEDADEKFYVAAYHWNFAAFLEDGTGLDKITVQEGTTVAIYAVNVLAKDAIKKLPAQVAEAIGRLPEIPA